ncbi:PREDICTED: protein NDNF isoform X1 [Lepidothrix coronata]|uniref:Protein NDNF n=2 Tax=Lepidothrix coronata TaxID=321398 RepID=A0A6J0I347_9PASS|nr:PREDICTED: protein NDNF isoform X1 [Lepidothrix coronata]XP_017680547.1 PREDICTED: protein NDNF isoform X1 [Lepidothrix coronata]XP_017680548.1 PREDICTED: protein NDNF isoform X1 [Lepidothrix coronata]
MLCAYTRMLLLHCPLLLLLLPLGSRPQKFPTRDEELFQMQIRDKAFFHDTSVIPDGAEISSYLFRDTPKRYFFVVEEDNTPLAVTVTPCDAPLEWKLSVQELPEEASGEGSGDPEPLEQQKQQITSEEGTELFSYKGNDVEYFVSSSSPSGLYQLDLLSTEKDTHFKVYATTTPESDQPYPELPYDPRIDVTSLGCTTVTLAWKPSPTASLLKQPIQYCIVINKEHNFKSLCAVEAKLSSDDAFMMAPKPGLDFSPFDFAHFGFPADNNSGKERGFLKPSKFGRQTPSKPRVDLHKVCIGNKNIFTVSDLKPDTQYYFDMFAVNTNTNMSTAYVGTFARTKEEAKQKTVELKDGKVTDVFIKRKGAKFLRFAPVSSHQKVTFSIHSCLDAVQIQVRRDGKLLLSQSVEGVRQFQLRGKAKAKYLVRLKGSKKGASMLKILATTRPNKQSFPSLPEDTRIKAFDKLRTCSSVTVAWLGTQERNKFCIYKREVDDNYNEEQKKREQNQCLGPDTRKKSDKVLCKYFHSQNIQKAVTTETIRGLQPGKSYLLDVYVIGHGGHSVKYQSKLVKTRKFC